MEVAGEKSAVDGLLLGCSLSPFEPIGLRGREGVACLVAWLAVVVA